MQSSRQGQLQQIVTAFLVLAKTSRISILDFPFLSGNHHTVGWPKHDAFLNITPLLVFWESSHLRGRKKNHYSTSWEKRHINCFCWDPQHWCDICSYARFLCHSCCDIHIRIRLLVLSALPCQGRAMLNDLLTPHAGYSVANLWAPSARLCVPALK